MLTNNWKTIKNYTMENQKTIKIFDKYLNRKMNQTEITEFEKTLKVDTQLQKEFLIHRSIYKIAQEESRKKMRDRFAKLEMEREQGSVFFGPGKTQIQTGTGRMAAFMYQLPIDSSSLPVTDDTIADFLAGDSED